MGLRGQYALEQMGVITLALVVIAALFFFSMNAASDGARAAQAKDTAERIARAADSAYALGPGSKSTVSVNMPQGVQFVDTSDKRVWIRVALSSGNTDVFAKTSGQIVGNIPVTAELQDITLTVLSNGNISVGRQTMSCSPSSFTKTIVQGGSAYANLTLFNIGVYSISGISSSISGVSDMVNGTPPSSVASGSSANISLSFAVPGAKPVGAYTGSISVNGSNGGACTSSITIFVTSSAPADIIGPVVSGILATPSNLTTITPATISATATDANNSIASCLLQLDSSGVWNTMDASDGSFSANMETIAYYLGYLDLGNHTVGIYCIDTLGNAGSQSSYTFSVSNATGGGSTDTQGPVVSNISITPSSPSTSTPSISVSATASDSGTGGGLVSMCQLKLDAGNYTNMSATDSAYDQVTENVNYSLGNLSAGNYTILIRCIDSLNNIGPASSFSFTVTAADTTGPIVHSITRSPSVATTTKPITVSAIGNDTTTGGSNISLCQLQLDGGAFASMNATDGAYNSPAESVNYSLGTLSSGSHTIGIKCNDSAGNFGATYNQSFTVQQGYAQNILFIRLGTSPTTTESRWQTWISGHTSNESFSWAYDTASVAQVAAGTVDLANYRIVVMADAQSTNANFWAKMNNYTATSHYVVLLGASTRYGLIYMGVATTSSSSQNAKTVVPQTSHYITEGFTIGTSYQIHSANNLMWYSTSFSGTNAVSTTSATRGLIIDHDTEFVLTYSNTRPDSFNSNGDAFATRVLDYALLQSG